MEASVGVLNRPSFFRKPALAPTASKTHSVQLVSRLRNDAVFRSSSFGLARIHASLSSPISPNPVPSNPLLSVASSPPSNSPIHFDAQLQSQPRDDGLVWNTAMENPTAAGGGGEESFEGKKWSIMVVLMGWLGAKTQNLRRYVKWYNSRGINAVTFVVKATEVLSFDMGIGLDKRVLAFGSELCSWASEREDDDRERCLIFHTFSNTGWYARILHGFAGGVKMKIRGVIVDSGGGDPFSSKVWAAGFTTAILGKWSSPIMGLVKRETSIKAQREETPFVEAMLSYVLEKLFVFALMLPASDKLRRAVKALPEHELSCPQLYLYSSADRIIPFESVELLVEEQRRNGMKVFSVNFGSSPHVYHYHHFPDIYSSQLRKFLRECFVIAKQTSTP